MSNFIVTLPTLKLHFSSKVSRTTNSIWSLKSVGDNKEPRLIAAGEGRV